MKRYLFQGVLLGCILALATPAWSVTMTTVGNLDTFIGSAEQGSAELHDSGEATETNWASSLVGSNLTLVGKIRDSDLGWNWQLVEGTTATYAQQLSSPYPLYFIVKTGSGSLGTGNGALYPNIAAGDDHFLFQNITAFDWAVVDFSALNFASNFTIDVFSHLTTLNGVPVPEAGALLMFGSGLIGLVGYRRMRRMQ